jgi:hypothetical protein
MVTEGEIEKAAERLCAKLTDSFYKLPPAHQMKVIMVALIDLLAHKGIRVVTDAQADALADDVEKGGGDG